MPYIVERQALQPPRAGAQAEARHRVAVVVNVRRETGKLGLCCESSADCSE
jgi:hypothetical protein